MTVEALPAQGSTVIVESTPALCERCSTQLESVTPERRSFVAKAEEAKDAVENVVTSGLDAVGNIAGILTTAVADIVRELSDFLGSAMRGNK